MPSHTKHALAAAMLAMIGTVPAVAQHAHDALDDHASFDRRVAAYLVLRDEATRSIPPLSVTADAVLIHYTFRDPKPLSEVRIEHTWGALKLTLSNDGYAFIPIAGSAASDSGSDACH